MEHGPYHHVYVSPHFDDVIFSCGGTIACHTRQRERALVLTVCSGGAAEGAPAAARRAGALAAFENLQLRGGEDRQAVELLGAHSRWLGEEDAIARDRRYRSLPGATGRPRRADAAVVERIVEAFREVPLAAGAQAYFPLGVGNHVDHQLAFAAGVRLSRQRSFGGQVIFYEDVPYVLIPHVLRQRLNALCRQAGVRWRRGPALRATRGVLARVTESASVLRELPLVARELTPLSRIALPLYVLAVQLQLIRSLKVEIPAGAALVPELHDVSSDRDAKLASVACYQSQVRVIMGTMEEMTRQLAQYSAALLPGASAAERFWRIELGSLR